MHLFGSCMNLEHISCTLSTSSRVFLVYFSKLCPDCSTARPRSTGSLSTQPVQNPPAPKPWWTSVPAGSSTRTTISSGKMFDASIKKKWSHTTTSRWNADGSMTGLLTGHTACCALKWKEKKNVIWNVHIETYYNPLYPCSRWEKAGQVSRELWEKAGEQGLLGLMIPEERGGVGGDVFSAAVMWEEQWVVLEILKCNK